MTRLYLKQQGDKVLYSIDIDGCSICHNRMSECTCEFDREMRGEPAAPQQPAETVYDYFLEKLEWMPADETLKALFLSSPCGQDCKRAIDAAVAMIAVCDKAVREEIAFCAYQSVEIFWHG
jgi:hypothetical protein